MSDRNWNLDTSTGQTPSVVSTMFAEELARDDQTTQTDEEKKGLQNLAVSNEHDPQNQTGYNKIKETADKDDTQAVRYTSGIQLASIVLALCLAIALVALDMTLLATAIPKVTHDFHSLDDIGWYGSAFFLPLAVLQPLTGKLFQLFSARWVYLGYAIIFEIGSLVCALAPNSHALIAGRTITGIGGAGILPGSLIIVSSIAHPKIQPPLNGLIIGFFGLVNLAGPVIGGAFTQHVTWRWCFYINLPIGGVAIAFLLLFFRPVPKGDNFSSVLRKACAMDWIGFFLVSGGTIMLLLALQLGGISRSGYPWNSSQIIGLLVGSVVTLVIFAVWQFHKQNDACIPPHIMRHRAVVLVSVLLLVSQGTTQLFSYYLPLYFQAVQGVSATASGVRYLPAVGVEFICGLAGGILIAKIGYYNPFFYLYLACLTVGAGLATLLKPGTSAGLWVGIEILAGAFNGFGNQLPFTVAQTNFPLTDVPVAISSLVYFQFVSCALFQAIAHNIFQARLQDQLVSSHQFTSTQIAAIIDYGASQVAQVIDLPSLGDANARLIIEFYNTAVTDTFYTGVVGGGLAFWISMGLKWTKVKQGPPPTSDQKGEGLIE